MSEPKTAEVKVVPSGWRMMESAPRDGTNMVLWFPDFPGSEVSVGYSRPEEFGGQMVDFWFERDTGEPFESIVSQVWPTHWMPLPTAPGEEAASPPAETGEGWTSAIEAAAKRVEQLIPPAAGGHFSHTNSMRVVLFDAVKAIRALSAQPVSPSEGEAVAWRWRWNADFYGVSGARPGAWNYCDSQPRNAEGIRDVETLYTHPASDQSDTERMRAPVMTMEDALKPLAHAINRSGTRPDIRMSGLDAVLIINASNKLRAALAEKAADK